MSNKNSRLLGIISSLAAALFTTFFGIFVIAGNNMIYFLVLIPVSMSVILAVYSMKVFVKPEKKVFIDCAGAFAIIYSVLVNMVYFTQMIPGVRMESFGSDILNIFADKPGTVFFYIDMFGYCMLCLATLFIAIAVTSKEKLLKIFSFIHSALFIPTFLLPFLPISFETEGSKGMSSGVFVLLAWCIIFIPVCILLTLFFFKSKK